MKIRAFTAAGALLLAVLGCRDDAESPTAPSALTMPQATMPATTTLAFRQVSASTDVTCGITTDFVAYCWGYSGDGQLGSIVVPESCRYEGRPCVRRPVAVGGGFHFRQISVGGLYHTCAVTTENRAYCWGQYSLSDFSATPALIAGGLQFRQVSAGLNHTCGVTTTDKAYCWGWNQYGQLGDGTTTPRPTPVPVRGGHAFLRVESGYYHTCGITTSRRALCWGSNQYGQLGDSTEVARRLVPVRVAGGRYYRQLDAGREHTCAVTTSFRAFCWGNGRAGQFGNGKTYLSFWPRRVASTLSFKSVKAGWTHTCGVTTENRAYCWGNNLWGQLGDGTTVTRLTPVAVAGGRSFTQVSVGMGHTCGLTGVGVAYCWGDNDDGQLGDGTSIGRLRPTPVVGPS